MNPIRIRCAICREYRQGVEQGDLLVSTYETKRDGVMQRDTHVRRAEGNWICASHKHEPLHVRVGDAVVTKDNEKGDKKSEVEYVTAIRSNGGFNLGKHNSYGLFGQRLRGLGAYNIIRIATPDDIKKQAAIDAEEKKRSEEANARDAERKRREIAIAEGFKKILPKDLTDVYIGVQLWQDDDYEITIHLKPEQIGVKL